jgi:hypothetical protein
MRRSLIHDDNQMARSVMIQHLGEELDDFSRGDAFLVESKQEVAPTADCRDSSNTATFPSDSDFRRPAPYSPCLAEEGREGNVGLVLKVQDGPEFPHRTANPGDLRSGPSEACALIKFVVLAFGLLVGESCFSQSPPHCILREADLISILNDCLYAFDSPKVGLVAELGWRPENNASQLAFSEGFENSGSPTSRLSMKPLLSFQSIAREPSMDGPAIGSKDFRDKGDFHASLDRIDRALPYFVRRVCRYSSHAGNIGSSGK